MSGRSTEDQRKALAFFQTRFAANEPFTPDDLTRAIGWSRASTTACLSKHACVFTKQLSDGRLRITQAFRRFRSWRSFQRLVSQSRRRPKYTYSEPEFVRTYEFLLPLANEELLREALDTLFYEDTIRARLREIPTRELLVQFPKLESEDDATHCTRLLAWLSSRFGGYSVYHVQGRFRAKELKSRLEAFQIETKGERYLVDETTAIARFVFPCNDEIDAARVHYFFLQLFVGAVLEVVSGEDQIWMIEGGLRNHVHIWTADED